MKKIMLLAAFGVAGLVSAKGGVEANIKAKETAKVTIQLCGVMVTFYNSENKPVRQQWFTSDQPNYNACQAYQAGVISDLQRQGYKVTKQDRISNVN